MPRTPRARLSPGDVGHISVSAVRLDPKSGRWGTVKRDRRTKADAWRARARYVDWEGKEGDVSRRAPTEAQAIAAVQQALRERLRLDASTIDASTPLLTACEKWLEDSRRPDSGRSGRTVAEYEGAYQRCIRGVHRNHRGDVVKEVSTPLKNLTLGQANDPQRLTRFLRTVADERGTASAKHVRAVLTGVLQDGVDMGILPINAMRSVGRVASTKKPQPKVEGVSRDTKRAFSDAERTRVLDYVTEWSSEPDLHYGTARQRRAVADLVRFLAGTGARIGEALALRWEHVDLKTGVTHIPGTKSAAAERTVTLPEWLRIALRDRAATYGRVGYVFPAPRRGRLKGKQDVGQLVGEVPWDESNCSKAVTSVLTTAGFPWARSHSFRKTVASRLSDAGVPLREVADQLGHKDAGFTASTYLGRSFTGDKAALAAHL